MDFIEEAENGDEEDDEDSIQEISDESDFEPVCVTINLAQYTLNFESLLKENNTAPCDLC